MKTLSRLIAGLTLLCGQASAATIGWETAPETINVSDTIFLDIIGSDFGSNVDGGGVNFAYDSSVLSVTSVSINEAVWDFGATGISTGAIDNVAGTVDGIMVNTFANVSGSFTVATIEFLAIGVGTSDLILSELGLNPWASGGSAINPTMASGSLTVIESSLVPVPAAVWLFGSGLLGLVGMARRK
jgi:hypothetical protein